MKHTPLRVEHMGKRIYLLDQRNHLIAEFSSDEDYDERLGHAVAIAKAVETYEIAETLYQDLTDEVEGIGEILAEFKSAWRRAHEG